MFAYPVILKADKRGGGFVATFPDIPEAITQGDTAEEAVVAAKEALETALDFYFEDRRAVPLPSEAKRGQRLVMYAHEPIGAGCHRGAAKAPAGGRGAPGQSGQVSYSQEYTTPQEVNRLTNLRHTTCIDGIAAALRAMGKHLDLRVV